MCVHLTVCMVSRLLIRGFKLSIEGEVLMQDIMKTDAGKRMAQHRHGFMEAYLTEFYAEWDGKS